MNFDRLIFIICSVSWPQVMAGQHPGFLIDLDTMPAIVLKTMTNQQCCDFAQVSEPFSLGVK